MSEWRGGSHGGGAVGLYVAILEDAERALNEHYGTLLEDRTHIEKLLTRELPPNGKNRPNLHHVQGVYDILFRWVDARCWFTVEGWGAVTMRQIFDIVAVDPEIKRKQLVPRFRLPWPERVLKETLEYYGARVHSQIIVDP